jgi:PIN domain nuclease of toxin-antitoxin system
MAKVVLDASAILAVLRAEPGAQTVAPVIADSLVSAVNFSEVIAKLIERGARPDDAEEIALGLPYTIIGFDADEGVAAARLISRTRSLGLSFGDRACLALAESTGLPALTADRSWQSVQSEIKVTLIRASASKSS